MIVMYALCNMITSVSSSLVPGQFKTFIGLNLRQLICAFGRVVLRKKSYPFSSCTKPGGGPIKYDVINMDWG